jgi:integrase
MTSIDSAPVALLSLDSLWTWWQSSPFAGRLRQVAAVASRWRRHILPALGQLGPQALTAEPVEQLLVELEAAGAAAETLNHLRSDLHRVIHDGRGARRWLGEDPTPYVSRRRRAEVLRPVLELDQVVQLVRHLGRAERHELAAQVGLAGLLGLRKGEALGLDWRDVDLDTLTLTVRRSHGLAGGKTGRIRVLPLPGQVAHVLSQMRPSGEASGWVFPGKGEDGRRGRDRRLSPAVREACAGAGVKVDPAFRFHDLRHSWATAAEDAGVPYDLRQLVMGHAGGITARYTHRTVERIREALKVLDPRG